MFYGIYNSHFNLILNVTIVFIFEKELRPERCRPGRFDFHRPGTCFGSIAVVTPLCYYSRTMKENIIVIDGSSLSIEQVVDVVFKDSVVSISDQAVSSMEASREIINTILDRGTTVYGVNTGFGRLCRIPVERDELEQLQLNLVRSHASGVGLPLPEAVVRSMLLLRANALAKGFSGIRPEVVHRLVDMINCRVHPIIPQMGSVGASGDLAPLAHMTLVLIGEGEALVDGERLPGAEALRKAGLKPVALQAKEGLSLVNGTQMMAAVAALALAAGEKIVDLSNLVGAMSLDASRDSVAPMDARIHACRPHPGQEECAGAIRRYLEGSEINRSHIDCQKIQDSYSFRCMPQVHGAVRDVLRFARRVITIEVNSATDNPLIFPESEDVLSGGNFHGEPVAFWLDFLAIALSELGSISERRIDKILDPVFNDGLPPFLAENSGFQSGYMISQYTAAALVSENKVLTHPAVVDTIPTSAGKEDHVSMGGVGATKLLKVLENVGFILSIEVLCAVQALDYRAPLKSGEPIERFKREVRQRLPHLTDDRPVHRDIETVRKFLVEKNYLLPVWSE